MQEDLKHLDQSSKKVTLLSSDSAGIVLQIYVNDLSCLALHVLWLQLDKWTTELV